MKHIYIFNICFEVEGKFYSKEFYVIADHFEVAKLKLENYYRKQTEVDLVGYELINEVNALERLYE